MKPILVLTVGVIGASRVYLSIAVQNVYDKDQVIANMQSRVFKFHPYSTDIYMNPLPG